MEPIVKLVCLTAKVSWVFSSIHSFTSSLRFCPNNLSNHYKVLFVSMKLLTQLMIWHNLNDAELIEHLRTLHKLHKTNKPWQIRVAIHFDASKWVFSFSFFNLSWLNLSFQSYKIRCKRLFMWNKITKIARTLWQVMLCYSHL